MSAQRRKTFNVVVQGTPMPQSVECVLRPATDDDLRGSGSALHGVAVLVRPLGASSGTTIMTIGNDGVVTLRTAVLTRLGFELRQISTDTAFDEKEE